MDGALLTLTPACHAKPPFLRAHSSPDLLSEHRRSLNLKSLPSLPAFDVPAFDLEFDPDFQATLRRNARSKGAKERLETTPPPPASHTQDTSPDDAAARHRGRRPTGLSRARSIIDRPRPLSWLPSSKPVRSVSDSAQTSSVSSSEECGTAEYVPTKPVFRQQPASFNEGSVDGKAANSRPTLKQIRRRSLSSLENMAGGRSAASASPTPSKVLQRASVYLSRIKERPQSLFVRSSASLSTVAAEDLSASLAFSSSSSSSASSSSAGRATGPASDLASQATTAAATESGQMSPQDPLEPAFRDLDAGFDMFAAKTTTAARIGLVHATLAPFLRSTAHHRSNRDTDLLDPERVDRRATILNRWWKGLLELLDEGQPRASPATERGPARLQPVAGADRPAVLDCIAMIMVRPEWRLCTSYMRSLTDRSPAERVRARSGTLGAADADIVLAESAEHNVRTMFVTNLAAQLALVVSRLAQRHVPASLATFGGKTCAYAFFFVPGAADSLVRLWGLRPDLLRRVVDDIKLPRRSRGESDDIAALFPPGLGALGWTSVRATADRLRRPVKILSPRLADIPWHGPWLSRWRGADSDTFFVFCKYFFLLSDQFTPSGLPLVEKARAPGFVLVLAQLLAILDNTIHRYSILQAAAQAGGFPAEGDLGRGGGADAALVTLPPSLPANSLFRGMETNRVIALLKDMLAAPAAAVPASARHTFIEALMAVAKAATRRTSRHDFGDCFMLCDFLDETLTALHDGARGQTTTSPPPLAERCDDSGESDQAGESDEYIDWPFWLDVCRKGIESSNAMCQVRMLSFVFSVWDVLVADAGRKETVCLNWLLEEKVFEQLFNSHSPLVRAYYMRLLCWRICRDSGSANELDSAIFFCVWNRLATVWSHYLWLKQDADLSGKAPPSTIPSLPTPARRFIIIRSEVTSTQPGLLAGGAASSLAALADVDSTDRSSAAGLADGVGLRPQNRRRWSMIGKVLSFASGNAGGTASMTNLPDRQAWDDDLDQARKELAAARSARFSSETVAREIGPLPPPKARSGRSSLTASTDSDSSTGSSPVFDATPQFVFKFFLGQLTPGMPSGLRERILSRPRLPAPAQARVRNARMRERGDGENTPDSGVPRSESPPPPAPGLPPATRRVSGLYRQTGLVSEARNADPRFEHERNSEERGDDRRGRDARRNGLKGGGGGGGEPVPSIPSIQGMDGGQRSSSSESTASPWSVEDRGGPRGASGRIQPFPQADQPTGIYAPGAKYTGRALAEWSIVVNECNSFVERRRDEGVLGLSEVEIPTLGVDGLRPSA